MKTDLKYWMAIVESDYKAYHGTKSPVDFAAFSIDHAGTANPTWRGEKDIPALWACESPKVAAAFADADPHGRTAEDGARVIPVIVHMNNPLVVDMDAERDRHGTDKYFNHRTFGRIWDINPAKTFYLSLARDGGHDGVIFKRGYDGWMDQGDIYAVFHSEQMQMLYGGTDVNKARLTEVRAIRMPVRSGATIAVRKIEESVLSMDNASRLARARQMGFDTSKVWYHATPYDFSEFVPNKWRGASYFAPTSDGAVRGASSGGAEHVSLSGPTTNAPATGSRVIPVYVAGRIWGRDPLPLDWLPQRLTYGQYKAIVDGRDLIELPDMSAAQNRTINYWRRKAASKYYTEAVPEEEYERYTGTNEDNLPLKLESAPVGEPLGYEDVEGGDRPSAFHSSDALAPAGLRDLLRKLGYVGWIVADEGGKSIAIADPTKIRAVTANFDPAKAGSANILS